ncbi:glutathione S-transferase C-terminal-like protein [Cristinia sonorae]|uniref:glutathione transferase n=1 Tax=Cristinia sonorae TaxID=1940300 RepID=A0A8K0URI4_9AGAR|nr:glutathione S-transferase C-terminal-like protein [Cristinia sonorae]
MSHGKHFTLFSSVRAPNGWKVANVLNALGLSFEPIFLEIGGNTSDSDSHVKGPLHTKYNPNGRIPTLIDHKNNDFVLWESGAIYLYLIDKYDTEHKFSFSTPEERAQLTQWLFFQASGQGPYLGQASWFLRYHPEKVPSAIERYQNETRRILGVLESVLSKQEWLVGGKLTVADMIFVNYNKFLNFILGDDFDFAKEFPATFAWHTKVSESEGVKKTFEQQAKALAAQEEKEKAAKA